MIHPMEFLNEIIESGEGKYPNAFVLSTSVNDIPDSRVVLAKHIDRDGVYFYTNYTSDKGSQMNFNRNVAALFYFDELGVQVRVNGTVYFLQENLSDDYYAQRDYLSKIGAWSSSQSRRLSSRIILILKVIRDIFRHGESPKRPKWWGGYILVPEKVEIMNMRKFRLHDRIVYVKSGHGWSSIRLYP